jgi:hypothetical protein
MKREKLPLMTLTRSNEPLTTTARRHFRTASAFSALLGAIACGGSDSTLLDVSPGDEASGAGERSATTAHELEHAAVEVGDAAEGAELERALSENQARFEQWQRDAEVRAAGLTAEERAALARLTAPSFEGILEEQEGQRRAALSPDEENTVRSLLAALDADAEPIFRGRTVLQGDVLHDVDELLASSGSGPVAKAEMLTGTQTTGGFYDVRPHEFAREDSQFRFWRPDTGRRYYVVVPGAANSFLFNALVQATNDIMAALPDDCLSGLFTVVTQSTYDQLEEIERITTSVITVQYNATICGGVVDNVNIAGCASYPFRQDLMQSPIDSLFRMRVGHILGFQPAITTMNPPPGGVTASNARDVALHELTHTLGFFHPTYPEFNPGYSPLTRSARVPTTAQGTAPSIMWTTAHELFSKQVTPDDRQALRMTYSGSCGYFGGLRNIGARCSAADENR